MKMLAHSTPLPVKLLIAVVLLVALLGMLAQPTTSSYDPALYGLPDTLAGYTVIAVQTPENTICFHGDKQRLTLQATENTIDHFLTNADPAAITTALIQLGLADQFDHGYTFVGPGVTREQIIQQLQAFETNIRAAWGGVCLDRPLGHLELEPTFPEPIPYEYAS
ncbi:MAG: hypothetical protein KC496_14210 [Anaerolineae bacterium]|nr:hypothetical protein [Anaerolineae bacterium]